MATEKNPHAVALGLLGAAKTTQAQRSAGGKARAEKLSPERRREIAKKANRASQKARKKAARGNKSGSRNVKAA